VAAWFSWAIRALPRVHTHWCNIHAVLLPPKMLQQGQRLANNGINHSPDVARADIKMMPANKKISACSFWHGSERTESAWYRSQDGQRFEPSNLDAVGPEDIEIILQVQNDVPVPLFFYIVSVLDSMHCKEFSRWALLHCDDLYQLIRLALVHAQKHQLYPRGSINRISRLHLAIASSLDKQ
jgi:hypothetical protein